MRRILQVVSAVALASTILPAVLFLVGSLELPNVKIAMLLGTVVWFIATPFWMGRLSENRRKDVML